MKYKIVQKNGKYRRKLELEWHEKLTSIVLIFAAVYFIAQIILYITLC